MGPGIAPTCQVRRRKDQVRCAQEGLIVVGIVVLPAPIAEPVAARAGHRPVGEARWAGKAVCDAMRPEEAIADKVTIALAGDALDDQPRGVIAQVGVLEACAGAKGGHRRRLACDPQQGFGGTRLAGREVLVKALIVRRQPVAVGHQLRDGDVGMRVLRHDGLHRAVHRQPALMHQPPQSGGGEGLGQRSAVTGRSRPEGRLPGRGWPARSPAHTPDGRPASGPRHH
jgi:hypothetical protein